MEQIYKMGKYLFLINFTKNNIISYFVILNIFIFIIFFSQAFFIIISIKLKNNHNNISLWPIYILQFIIPFISSNFFSQIFYTLLSIFYCDEKNNNFFFIPSYKCLNGKWFNIQASLCIISIVILLFISYITNSIFYNPMCLRAQNKKIHPLPDKIFLFTKIILNISFLLLKNKKDNFPLLIVSILITGINSYYLYKYQGYHNKNLFFINRFLSLLLFWGFGSLFLGKIFNIIGFNGAIYLFFIGIGLILLCFSFETRNNASFFMKDKSKINTSIEYYKYILELQTLIENKAKSRENKILLKSFLEKQEETCYHVDCFLKRYLNCLSNGIDSDILLYYYMQTLFEFGLSKFNNDLSLTISYIYFLIKRLSKKKKAITLYESINKRIFAIDKLFNIYRCEKILETLWTGFDGKDKENIESEDIIKLFDYKNNVNIFKDLLNKISLLYYDFWLSLYSNNCEGKEDFEKLNEIGIKINRLLNQVENSFNLVFSINNEDIDILKLYMEYFKNILNDDDKFEKYHLILSNISLDFDFKRRPIDYVSFDINDLYTDKKEKEYFIINASEDDIDDRKILNMSIGLSSIIGYQKSEIIGKDINILIPRIFHKIHNKVIRETTSRIKLDLYQTLSNNLKYNPENLCKTKFCKNKSNFLIPLEFNSYLVQNEEGEHIYIIEIKRSSSFPTSWNEKGEAPPYCVLTDSNFIIQSFTPNCCDLLGLNSNAINSHYEITSYIMQFNNDILNHLEEKIYNNNEDKSECFSEFHDNSDFGTNSNIALPLHFKKRNSKRFSFKLGNTFIRNTTSQKINTILKQLQNNKIDSNLLLKKIKRKIIKNKYELPQIINWKINNNTFNEINEENKPEKRNSGISNKIFDFINKKLELYVKECRISNSTIGYYFFFKKLKIIGENENGENINYFNKYISNTEDFEQSDYKMNEAITSYRNINKSCTEDSKNISGVYLSKIILKNKNKEEEDDEDDKLENNIIKNINQRRISVYFNEEENKYYQMLKLNFDPNEKEIKLNDKKDLIFKYMKSSFIPSNYICFEFNLESMTYVPKKVKNYQSPRKDFKRRSSEVSNILAFYQNKILLNLGDSYYNDEESSESYTDSESLEESDSISNDSSSSSTSKLSRENEEIEEKENLHNISLASKKYSQKDFILKSDKEKSIFDSLTPKNINVENMGVLKKLSFFQNNYYRVNFKKIRFFKYDFIQDMIVEINNYERTSQIEKSFDFIKHQKFSINPKNNFKELKTTTTFIHKKENKGRDSRFRHHHHSTKKYSRFLKQEIVSKKQNDNTEKKIFNDKKKELEGKIKESLNQEDKQVLIQVFLIITLISVLIIIILGIISNYFIINEINIFKNYIKYICYTSEIRVSYNEAVYYLRELTLVNCVPPENKLNQSYSEYIAYKDNKTKYKNYIRNRIENLYVYSHILSESFSTIEVPLSNKAIEIINKNFTIYYLKDDLTVYNTLTTYYISLIQLNSALNNLATSDLRIQQNSTDVYTFIYNYLNKIGENIIQQIEIYLDELKLRIKKIKTTILVGIAIIFIIIIIIYIIICIGYKFIIKKKSSYIEGFYGIKLDYIKQSIANCEHFIYILKKQRKDENSETIIEEKSEYSSNNYEEEKQFNIQNILDNKYLFDKIDKNEYNSNKGNVFNKSNNKKHKKYTSITLFATITFFYLILIFLILIFSGILFFLFMNDILRNCIFMFHLQRKNNNIFELINIYREYLFDPNSIVFDLHSLIYLQIKEEEIFKTKGNDSFILESTYNLVNHYKDVYIEFNNKTLCSRRTGDYFITEEDCLNFLQGQIKYGYEIAYYTLSDLIRLGKNMVEYFINESMDIVGNLTEFGRKNYDEFLDNQTFRLYLFNNETIHRDLNVLFAQSLLPYITEIINITSNIIIKNVDNSDSKYYIYMIFFILLNLIIYLFVWLPFIKNMNSVIYNAKKILGIIPIQVLTSIVNIKKILNLEKNKDD